MQEKAKFYFRLCKTCLTDAMFPPRCPVCDGVLPTNSRHIPHMKCDLKLHYISEPSCMLCGQPIDSMQEEYCADCKKHPHNFRQGKGIFLYEGSIKLSMYKFKYSNRREYAEFYAQAAWLHYQQWFELIRPDLILPVPMYPKKKRKRGYNQAEIFAQALSQVSGIPCHPELARRIRNTTPQKLLSYEQRKNNLKNSFLVLQSVSKYRTILLVDDIYTTGSTIDAVAKELEKYAITNIYFLCICIGRNL